MSIKTVSSKALNQLMSDVSKFDDMPSPKQAAFRARVSRYLSIVSDSDHEQYDPKYTEILTAVQNRVGASAVKSSQSLTVDDIEKEFSDGLDYGDSRKLAAYRAKAKRLYNKAVASDDTDTADRVNHILNEINDMVDQADRDSILAMAIKAGLVDK